MCQHPTGVLSIQITAYPPPPGTPDIRTPALRTLLECRRYRRVAEKTGLHAAPCSGTLARRGHAPGAATPQGLHALALGLAPGAPTPRPARSSPSPLLRGRRLCSVRLPPSAVKPDSYAACRSCGPARRATEWCRSLPRGAAGPRSQDWRASAIGVAWLSQTSLSPPPSPCPVWRERHSDRLPSFPASISSTIPRTHPSSASRNINSCSDSTRKRRGRFHCSMAVPRRDLISSFSLSRRRTRSLRSATASSGGSPAKNESPAANCVYSLTGSLKSSRSQVRNSSRPALVIS